MTNGSTISIKLGAVELNVSGEVDREQLDAVLGALRSHLPELLESPATREPAISARALLDASSARTHGEKAGVVAYWLEHHRGRERWRSSEIVDALREAGEEPPANITDALNQKARKDLFEVQDRRWRLTGEGRGWVKYQLLDQRVRDDG
jgi:hypothetical protein